jgi:hypothetical protein
VAGQGPDADRPAVGRHALQAGQAADVDDQGGGGETKLEEWDQALAAGHHLGLVALLGKESEGLVESFRGTVVEGGWKHLIHLHVRSARAC